MKVYRLPEEAYQKKIREGERWAVSIFLISSIVILLILYTFRIITHWGYLVAALPMLWLMIEACAILVRRYKVKRWFNYEIKIEDNQLSEIVNGVVKSVINRENITAVLELSDNLTVESELVENGVGEQAASIEISNEIEGFDEIKGELLTWRPKRKIKLRNPILTFDSPQDVQSSDSIEFKRKRSYQETRMEDVRQARRDRARKERIKRRMQRWSK